MEIQRTEEETVEHLKQWLRENGMAIVLGVVIGVSGITGVRYWFTYQQSQAEEASVIYDKIASSLTTQNYPDVLHQGKKLIDAYDGTSYAILGSFAMAKASLATGDAAAARDSLAWALDKARDEAMQHIARIRLARLFFDAKDYPAALKLITDTQQGAFGSLYEELRGDIYTMTDKVDQAREAYRLALLGAKDSSRREFVQMKLDNLAAIAPSSTPSTQDEK
ncbi:MAG: tetratricopeptide repeat protein [Gammaproteobacteria bacterium]|nr:tetratricopeptide repeat protein [Gammaproteobacteria bacterium]